MRNGSLWKEPGGDKVLAGRVLTGALLSALILFTLLGNALVCVAVLRYHNLRAKVTNLFIVSLALSDLLLAVLVMPWKAAAEVASGWPFGPFCKVWLAFDIMCSTASILNLCVISVDRYWAIASPFRYERRMSRRLALLVVGLTWALAVLVSFVPVQLDWHTAPAARSSSAPRPPPRGQRPPANCDSSLNRAYAISSSLISFYIPVAIMLVTYGRIYRIARVQIRRIAALERAAQHARSCRQEQHRSLRSSFYKETKVLKTLSVIMGVFVCCWLPFFVLNCLVPFCDRRSPSPPCVSETTFDVFVWFGWANSALNPVVYAFNAEFRQAFSGLLGCTRVCCAPTAGRVHSANISNELVSYHQETALQREVACADMIPNAVQRAPAAFDSMSQISAAADEDDEEEELASDSAAELGLTFCKITPFTPNGVH
ncbi:D(1) dopamine receptor [Rhincodon typus]|uniref:D(1) dopamine receptor n=1 Tax=Rhincodon typus TaxID=259920 RepID=UPI00202F8811|nr:D(1) dopamine receptor [Rhincodon typus]